jgi:hypothetical protein
MFRFVWLFFKTAALGLTHRILYICMGRQPSPNRWDLLAIRPYIGYAPQREFFCQPLLLIPARPDHT